MATEKDREWTEGMTPNTMKARIALHHFIHDWTLEHSLDLEQVIDCLARELHNHKLAAGGATEWEPPRGALMEKYLALQNAIPCGSCAISVKDKSCWILAGSGTLLCEDCYQQHIKPTLQ